MLLVFIRGIPSTGMVAHASELSPQAVEEGSRIRGQPEALSQTLETEVVAQWLCT